MDAGVNILCYKSKTLANGAHPLMIRVCKDGKKKYVSLGVSVLPQFWDFTKNQPKKNCPNKAYGKSSVSCPLKPSDSAPLC